ncbi:MAG: hypothetical protein WC620_01105 [Methanoregula sp.]|jgi:hypothetical protein
MPNQKDGKLELLSDKNSVPVLVDFDILLPGHGVPLRDGASAKVREFAASLPADG